MIKQRLFFGALASLTCGLAWAATAEQPACTQPLIAKLQNSCIVQPGVLWRGARPDTVNAAELVSLGVRSVVNLELLNDDSKQFLAINTQLREPSSVSYYRLREWEPNVVVARRVVDRHVARFIAIMRTQPKPVYVHCRSGQNRTGVMVAAWQVIEQGMSIDSAIEEMRRYQGIWFKQDAAYIRGLDGARRARIDKLIIAEQPKVKATASWVCDGVGCKP